MVFIRSYTQSWCVLGSTLSHGVYEVLHSVMVCIRSYTPAWCVLGPTLTHGVYKVLHSCVPFNIETLYLLYVHKSNVDGHRYMSKQYFVIALVKHTCNPFNDAYY